MAYEMKTGRELQELNNEKQTGEVQSDLIPDFDIQQPTEQVPPSKYGYGPVAEATMDRLTGGGMIPRVQNLAGEEIEANWGSSRFDTRNAFRPGMDLEDTRAREQSGLGKITNGLAKGSITATTTAVNTTLGTVWGLGASLFELASNGNGEGTDIRSIIDAGTNNWLSEQAIKLQTKSEEWFPIHRTEEERSDEYQREWQKHIFTANFIGDSLLKNFGFTVGVIAGGAAWAKGLSAVMRATLASNLMKGVAAAAEGDTVANAKLVEAINHLRAGTATAADTDMLVNNINGAAQQINGMKARLALYGSLVGAMGEGSMEGIMAKNEFLDDYKQRANRDFTAAYDSIQDDVLAERDPRFVERVPFINQEGEPDYLYQLNDDGVAEVNRRRADAVERYQDLLDKADEEGERLATTTYLLNLPILTASNVIQFGKLFSGGFKTAKKVAGLRGGIRISPKGISGAYESAASPVLRALANSAKVAGSEAFEEMSQGTVSSGAKNVAGVNMAGYVNGGFDPEQTGRMRDWFGDMYAGGTEYLGDWKNWQEGFLGAVTGLFGMPGRFWKGEWNGGLIGAVQDAREEKTLADKAAEDLNKLVNSEKFQNNWRGYIRHLKYDAEMVDAIGKDDAYAWHTADKDQLISDTMLFAKNGRLNDLQELVNYYGNLSEQDVERLGLKELLVKDHRLEGNETNAEIVGKVKKKADEISTAIKQYKNLYDALITLMPAGTNPDLMDELMFTGMELKSFEERFLKKYGEVMEAVAPKLSQLSRFQKETEGDTVEQKEAKLRNIQQMYAEIFSTLEPIDIDLQLMAATNEALSELKALVKGDKQLTRDVEDLEKISKARRAFYQKYRFLQTPKGAEVFNNIAITVDKVAKEAKRQADIAETEGLDSMATIHQRFNESTDKGAFVDALRTRAKDDKLAQDFVGMYNTYNSFRDHLLDNYPQVVNQATGGFDHVAEAILAEVFDSASNEDDYVSKLETGAYTQDAILERLNEQVQKGLLDEEDLGPAFPGQFANASAAIQRAAAQFQQSWKDTAGKKGTSTKEIKVDSTPKTEQKGPDAPADSSKSQNPPQQSENPAPEPVPSPVPASEPEVTGEVPGMGLEEPVEEYSEGEAALDTVESYDEEKGTKRPEKGYYQQSIPEIDLFVGGENFFLKLRDFKEKLKKVAAGKGEKSAKDIKNEINDASPLFVDNTRLDEKGNVIHESYSPIYNWLRDNGAFQYISTQLKEGDELVFCYMDGCPMYDNRPQVVVGVVAERNADGEITRVQPLTTLHQPNYFASEERSYYNGLNELYDALQADYESREPDGPLYVFGGLKNPITSKVWDLRPGVIPFGTDSVDIRNVPSFSDSGPIILVGENGDPIFLQGNLDPAKVTRMSSSGDNSHYGQMYYLVRNADDYTPIHVNTVKLDRAKFDSAVEGGYVDRIKKLIGQVDDLVPRLTDTNAKELNEKVSPILRELNRYMNLTNVVFQFQNVPDNEGNMMNGLRIAWGRRQDEQAIISPEGSRTVLDVLSSLERTPRLSPRMERRADTLKNFKELLAEGLITTRVGELRARGVNFYYNPWNPSTESFEFDAEAYGRSDDELDLREDELSNEIKGPGDSRSRGGLFPEGNLFAGFYSQPEAAQKIIASRMTPEQWDSASLLDRTKRLGCL